MKLWRVVVVNKHFQRDNVTQIECVNSTHSNIFPSEAPHTKPTAFFVVFTRRGTTNFADKRIISPFVSRLTTVKSASLRTSRSPGRNVVGPPCDRRTQWIHAGNQRPFKIKLISVGRPPGRGSSSRAWRIDLSAYICGLLRRQLFLSPISGTWGLPGNGSRKKLLLLHYFT